jgi:hypothetical protein
MSSSLLRSRTVELSQEREESSADESECDWPCYQQERLGNTEEHCLQ